jgi:hypothetical protein
MCLPLENYVGPNSIKAAPELGNAFSRKVKKERLNSKVYRTESQRAHVFSHIWNIDPIQIQQYYKKQVVLRGGHI